MGPLDAFWHLANLLLPAFGTAVVAAAAAKRVWRSAFQKIPWWRLALRVALAGTLAVLGALGLFGRDGTMAGYALLVGAQAVVLWWVGLRPGAGRG